MLDSQSALYTLEAIVDHRSEGGVQMITDQNTVGMQRDKEGSKNVKERKGEREKKE